MSLTLYEVGVPPMLAGLKHLAACLERGRAHADENGIAHAALLDARLIDDMLSLTQQVQRASDTAKFTAVRVAEVETVAMPDTETTFADLQRRIAATRAFLEAVPPAAFDGREEAEVILTAGQSRRAFTGRSYVLGFALPNFFFHVTTAYDLLRHRGVPLGKRDFLGWS